MDGSELVTTVDKRVILLMSAGFRNQRKEPFVSTVGNRVILLGIAKPQRPGRRRMWHKELDPLLEEVPTVWALE